jgi:hypothetical protein
MSIFIFFSGSSEVLSSSALRFEELVASGAGAFFFFTNNLVRSLMGAVEDSADVAFPNSLSSMRVTASGALSASLSFGEVFSSSI